MKPFDPLDDLPPGLAEFRKQLTGRTDTLEKLRLLARVPDNGGVLRLLATWEEVFHSVLVIAESMMRERYRDARLAQHELLAYTLKCNTPAEVAAATGYTDDRAKYSPPTGL